MSVGEIVALTAVAFGAAAVDAIAGGGGLLTVPALLLAGLDPVSALATNKCQGTLGTISAAAAFSRAQMVDWRVAAPTAAMAGATSIVGAASVGWLPREAVSAMAPILLLIMAVWFAFGPRATDVPGRARLTARGFALTVAPGVGFYDGAFGPGAGAFYTLGGVSLLGLGVTRATALTKVCNAASNLGALALFAATGAVAWEVALPMVAGAVLGAQMGARLALRWGGTLIRPLLIMAAGAAAVRLALAPGGFWRGVL